MKNDKDDKLKHDASAESDEDRTPTNTPFGENSDDYDTEECETIIEAPGGSLSKSVDTDKSADPTAEEHTEEFEDGFDDFSPTIMEGSSKPAAPPASSPSANDGSVETSEEEFDDGFDDFSPTIMEGPGKQSTPSPKKSDDVSESANTFEEFDDGYDDYSPTILEIPGGSPVVDSNDQKTDSEFNEYDEFDDDFAPTIVEGPAGKKASTDLSADDEDDDYAPTIAETPGEQKTPTSMGSSSTHFSITQHVKSASASGLLAGGSSVGKDEIDIQKYDIGEKIAEGGMGAILSANDLNIRRNVAMKVLLANKEKTDETVFRFIEEAQVTGQLEHPSIVPVYELGFNDQGEVFYSMKLVKGVTLKDVLKNIRKGEPETISQYPLSRLLTIFQKICDAMAFAHAKGVIHRDLKPENVMVGGFGEVLVMDWGLAKNIGISGGDGVSTIRSHIETKGSDSDVGLADDDGGVDSGTYSGMDTVSSTRGMDSLFNRDDSESMNTMDGAIMGTPNFMAPEQATGQNNKMDARTDIYALGGMLYNILTLRVPISGKSLTEMMVNIVRGNIPPPLSFNQPVKSSAKTKEKDGKAKADVKFLHCPGGKIPEALSAVTMKALAVKQEERYQTVKELQQDIEAYQGGFATSAEDAGLFKLMILLIKRHKLVSAVSAIFLVLSITMATAFITKLNAKNRDLENTNTELAEKKDTLEQQKDQLQEQKVELVKQKDDLQNTVAQLEEEKRRTESERKAKEVESKLKDKEREAKLAEMEHREHERLAKEKERGLKELEREAKLKEREEKLKERELRKQKEELAKQEQAKRVEVSQTSAPEFVTKGYTLANKFQWEDAHAAVNTALDLDPLLSDAWYLKGWLFFGELKFNQTLAALKKSVTKDEMAIKELAEKYGALKNKSYDDRLTIFELRDLSNELKKRGAFTLSERTYKLFSDREKEVITRLNKIRLEIKKANLELEDINFQYTFSDDMISLDLSYNEGLRNLRPLTGLPITHLDLRFTQAYDLRPIEGMPLKILHIPAGQSLEPEKSIKSLPLQELHVHGKPTKDYNFVTSATQARLFLHLYSMTTADDFDLEYLRNVNLSETILSLHGEDFHDLELFAGIELIRLSLVDTEITNLAPIQFKKLVYLDIDRSDIKSIKPINEMPIRHLSMNGTAVKDISVLEGMELDYLSIRNTKVREIDVLTAMPIKYLDISGTEITDFTPLRGMPLEELHVENLPIIDFDFLKGAKLRSLFMSETFASDIRILKGMRLKELDIGGTRITSINVLEHMPLIYLSLKNTPVNDLTVLKGMPLRHLDISNTPVKDIRVLQGMNLNFLSLASTDVTDLTPLEGMPLKSLSLENCNYIDDIFSLAKCKNLYKLIIPKHIETVHFLKKFLYLEYLAYSGDLAELSQTTAQFWGKFEQRVQ